MEKVLPKVEIKQDDIKKTLEDENTELHIKCNNLTQQVKALSLQANLFEIQSDMLAIISELTDISNKVLNLVAKIKKGE